MSTSRLRAFVLAPMSNKLLVFRNLYWELKSRYVYRFLFRRFGRNSRIYAPLFIYNADCIEIGEDVLIWEGIRMEAMRDAYGRTPRLVIGSRTSIQQDVHIACHNRISIGEDVVIAARCAIVDITHPYHDINAPNVGDLVLDESSFVEIGDGAFIGYGAVILPNVRIGKRAVVGANSVITHDVPDFSVSAGSPARLLKRYSPELKQWVRIDSSTDTHAF